MSKPYSLWVKQCGQWAKLGESHNPLAAEVSPTRVSFHGSNVERVELRDQEGTLETFYDRNWN